MFLSMWSFYQSLNLKMIPSSLNNFSTCSSLGMKKYARSKSSRLLKRKNDNKLGNCKLSLVN